MDDMGERKEGRDRHGKRRKEMGGSRGEELKR